MRASLSTLLLVLVALTVACSSSGSSGGDAGVTDAQTDLGPAQPLWDAADGGGDKDGAQPDLPQPDGVTPPVDSAGDSGGAGCEPAYATRCQDDHTLEWCVEGQWVWKADCPGGALCSNGQCVDMTDCAPGSSGGCQSVLTELLCNAAGTAYDPITCPQGQYCINGACQDAECIPGETRCQDPEVLLRCEEDGSGWVYDQDCPDGEVCSIADCVGGCEAQVKNPSYIGCTYWTVDLDQYHDPMTNPKPDEVPHTVVIANPGEFMATILFEPADPLVSVNVADPYVPPGESRAFVLPRWDVDGSGVMTRGIRIRSSQPVMALQFNPFENEAVFSNGASLLLPEATLGMHYWIMTWPTSPNILCGFGGHIPPQYGYFTVLATQPGITKVTVTVTGMIKPTNSTPEAIGVPAMTAGDTQLFLLERGEVLNLEAMKDDVCINDVHLLDLTGSHVVADRPVAVFGGHEEAVVTWSGAGDGNNCCAEHLEEQLFPLEIWGSSAVAAKTKPRGGEPDIWRVMSGVDGNTITTNPAQPDCDGVTLNAGEWVEFESFDSFEIIGTGAIQVGQYTMSQAATPDFIGDPDFFLAVPTTQYRQDYPIAVPDGFTQNHITIVRPAGAAVTLDALPVDEAIFTPFGSGTWEVGYLDLEPGMHNLWATAPVGVYAYGYAGAVSYGYPAGLNLDVQ